jgi:hypothetical protein
VDRLGTDWNYEIDPDYFDWFTPKVANNLETGAIVTSLLAGGVVVGSYGLATAIVSYTSSGSILSGVGVFLGTYGILQAVNTTAETASNPAPAYLHGQSLYQQNGLTVALDAASVIQSGLSDSAGEALMNLVGEGSDVNQIADNSQENTGVQNNTSNFDYDAYDQEIETLYKQLFPNG